MRSKQTGLTAERVREALTYDPATGIFRWRVRINRSGPDHTGKVAGCLNNYGYRIIRLDGRLHLAHLLAWLYVTGKWPEREVDHRDGNVSNNSWKNLRHASSSQNKMNSRLRADKIVQLKGVSLNYGRPKGFPFRARIQINGEQTFLGYFRSAEAAHAAYQEAAMRLFGEFARAG